MSKTSLKSGRTIGERREHLETASERMATHKKIKFWQRVRLIFTALLFLTIIALVIYICVLIFHHDEVVSQSSNTMIIPYSPTIEVIDEDTTAGGRITSRMKEYIGQAEADFRELGYQPIKAVIPVGSIREVDFYLDGYTGFIKMIIDRGTGVSVEDADRMIRYLADIDIGDFAYIDVRIEGKAYWK
ncbi:hypothetical protein IJJ36_00225 [Candidatus Saccharibacteria bacterium]|nr:hypothetical protein [Candidatus Saccharibacteria bacterium]